MARAYQIGYGKPPAHSRFKPGRTGNAKGRPPKSLNLKTELTAELGETITVRENGKPRRVSKQTALLKALIAKALRGDVKAIGAVLALSSRLIESVAQTEDDTLGAEELAILKRFTSDFGPDKRRRARSR